MRKGGGKKVKKIILTPKKKGEKKAKGVITFSLIKFKSAADG